MNRSLFTAFFLLIFVVSGALAQEFLPGVPIPVPEPELNTGGVGDIVTNVDYDNDGRVDLYWINQQWADDPVGSPQEQTPRLYKFEYNGSAWEIVWQCTLTVVTRMNSFPALAAADLDQDGLGELIWAPPNWIDETTSANPYRLIVFEQSENGGDTLGVPDGFGNYMPNSMWTITDQDDQNVRPRRIEVADIDGDDTLEVIFSDRAPSGSANPDWFFGICSVTDIPNDGDGSETWTLESSGIDFGLDLDEAGVRTIENKWDMAVMYDHAYFFDELVCTAVKATAPNTYELAPAQSSVLPNGGSWNSAVTADIDNNGTMEIIVGSFWNTLGQGETHGIYLYTREYPLPYTPEVYLDTLYGKKIYDLGDYFTGYGVMGGKLGDVDQDGNPDYIFGSRNADPNGAIFRLEYTGPPDSVFNETFWEFSVIDSHFADLTSNTGRWDHIDIVDFDSDPLLEVLNTSLNPAGGGLGTPDETQPVYVLENQTELDLGPWQHVDVPYVFVDKWYPAELGAGHGITVDKYGNIWYGEFSGDDRLKVFAPDGTPLDTLGLITVPIPGAGRDTTFTLNDCRGLDTDIDGNILFARSGLLLKIDVDTREPITYYPFSGSPLNPAVDDQGFIYVGLVVGVTPIDVINPTTFLKEQEIVLQLPTKHTGFARGLDVSLDGLTLYPGDLAGDPHMVPIYTSTDYVNYNFTDSIYTDNTGTVIMQQQTVTVSTKPGEGTIWYSIDNAYGTGGNDQLDNNLTMMDFAKNEYGLLYMPPPVGPTGLTGPRGAAWSPTGDTLYVASWGEGAIYRYVHENVLSIEEEGEGGLPIAYKLNQNYPNPFNPITNIEFTVPKAGKVTLSIFNVLGQKVATLVDQNVPRGTFKVQFDASKYASGMYFYRLQATDIRIEKKMMLLK